MRSPWPKPEVGVRVVEVAARATDAAIEIDKRAAAKHTEICTFRFISTMRFCAAPFADVATYILKSVRTLSEGKGAWC